MNVFKWCGKRLKDLFYEEEKLSLSRIILVVLVFIAIGFWVSGIDIPGTMLTFLITDAGYVFGQKALNSYKEVKIQKNTKPKVV